MYIKLFEEYKNSIYTGNGYSFEVGDEIEPNEVYEYITDLHEEGYEGKEYEDEEWVNSFSFFKVENVKIDSLKISAFHGALYKKLKTQIPPIVVDGNERFILDGNHRAKTAESLGYEYILALIGYK